MDNAIIGQENNLYHHLKEELSDATKVKFIVSFIMESGVKLIVKELKKLALKGIPIQIITGTYLNITEPSALYLLKSELGNMVDIKLYSETNISFHPKTYIIHKEDDSVIFIGSSNISRSALISGIEWNYRLYKALSPKDFNDFDESFDYIFNNKSEELTEENLKRYAISWTKPKFINSAGSVDELLIEDKPQPRGAQIEALYELKLAREEGVNKGIVIAATGIGKTYLAAFDSYDFKKILFIAHRKEILEQAEKTFKSIRKDADVAYFDGNNKNASGDIVFASVQTLGKKEYLNEEYFSKDYFDYIIVDEFHHAAANSYKNILDYFSPKFMLGLTATPYRMDNKDIYELCDNNVIYQMDFKNAINRDLLVPFKYYGIYDETDYDNIEFTNGKYNTKQLEEALSIKDRANLILKNYLRYKGKRALGFCSSIKHAEYMAKFFNDNNIKAASVHSLNTLSDNKLERDEAIKQLEAGEIDIIFSVDIFNEGVDIPSLDTVMFLRPTESYVIFLQQLGRGLRKYSEKNYLTVLDFIGNYKRAHYIPKLLAGENPLSSKNNDYRKIDELEFPDDCYINFDFKLIDLFDEMRKRDPLAKRMKEEYFRVKGNLGCRPTRLDIYEGIDVNLREYIKDGYLRFLYSINELNEIEEAFLGTIAEELLKELEKTSMTKSYKIPTLLTFIDNSTLKPKVSFEEVGISFMNYYKEYKQHSKDLNNKRHNNWQAWDLNKFTKEALQNPIMNLVNSPKGLFLKDEINKVFYMNEELYPYLNSTLKDHFEDILKVRSIDYFRKRFKED